jgi:hypothetical protein
VAWIFKYDRCSDGNSLTKFEDVTVQNTTGAVHKHSWQEASDIIILNDDIVEVAATETGFQLGELPVDDSRTMMAKLLATVGLEPEEYDEDEEVN